MTYIPPEIWSIIFSYIEHPAYYTFRNLCSNLYQLNVSITAIDRFLYKKSYKITYKTRNNVLSYKRIYKDYVLGISGIAINPFEEITIWLNNFRKDHRWFVKLAMIHNNMVNKYKKLRLLYNKYWSKLCQRQRENPDYFKRRDILGFLPQISWRLYKNPNYPNNLYYRLPCILNNIQYIRRERI